MFIIGHFNVSEWVSEWELKSENTYELTIKKNLKATHMQFHIGQKKTGFNCLVDV